MLQSMGSQRVKHDLTTEQQQRRTGVCVRGWVGVGVSREGNEQVVIL